MRYFVIFKDDLVSTHWEREDDISHPNYIPKDEIYEVTEEQYRNTRNLILNLGVVEYDAVKRQKYLDKTSKRSTINNSKDKLKALSNAEVAGLNSAQIRKVLKHILDVVVERDELSDEVL